MRDDTTPDEPKENIVHFNPWRDFNDAAPQIDVFGDEPDPAQIAQFMQVVFGYCDGLIPVRSFIDKGRASMAARTTYGSMQIRPRPKRWRPSPHGLRGRAQRSM
jgi:hypothetical protein